MSGFILSFLNEKLIKYLEECDLTHNDAIIYLSILELGSSGPSEIAAISGVQRPRVYDSLRRLVDRGFITQSLRHRRPIYSATDHHLVLSELEANIDRKKKALDNIHEFFLSQTFYPRAKGIYSYNHDEAVRNLISELLRNSQKKIFIMAVLPQLITDDRIVPFDLLSQKNHVGQKVTLLLNVHAKNWESCLKLYSEKVQIYHSPYTKDTSIIIHLIDDESLCLSYFNPSNPVKLEYGIYFCGEEGFIKNFAFHIDSLIKGSVPLEARLKELENSIVYPTDKLKSMFGVRE